MFLIVALGSAHVYLAHLNIPASSFLRSARARGAAAGRQTLPYRHLNSTDRRWRTAAPPRSGALGAPDRPPYHVVRMTIVVQEQLNLRNKGAGPVVGRRRICNKS